MHVQSVNGNMDRRVDNYRGVCASICVRIKVGTDDVFFCKCPTHMGDVQAQM